MNRDNTHNVLGQSNNFYEEKRNKSVASDRFFVLTTCLTVPQYCVCPRRTRLYINYFGKVYGQNALDFHFWNASDVSTVQLYSVSFRECILEFISRHCQWRFYDIVEKQTLKLYVGPASKYCIAMRAKGKKKEGTRLFLVAY